jgi:hypothetical protein
MFCELRGKEMVDFAYRTLIPVEVQGRVAMERTLRQLEEKQEGDPIPR